MCTNSMELNYLIRELETCTEDTVIFRKLINYASSHKQPWNNENLKEWQPVLAYILQTFIPNTEIGRERTLLASHTFFALLSMQPTLVLLKDTLNDFLKCNSNELYFLDEKYDTIKPELFQLICAYGYLQVNCKEIYSDDDVCVLILNVVYEHCIKYTKHSYFAYKILYLWLRRTMDTDFWNTCDIVIEQKLEAIIFSNWCNAINEISKQNSTSVFNMYLKIMEEKYNGYLEYVFKYCVDKISWQNEIKYDILAEICQVWDNVKIMTSHDFLFSVSTSLTKHYLRSAGTKVYIAIIKKLSEDEWKETFGHIINYLFHDWGTMENTSHNDLQFLCKYWLEPIVKKYRNILPYLWDLTRDINGLFLCSHLQRMASEMRIDLPQQPKIECYINHNEEIIRLNGFAINCYQVNKFYNENRDQFYAIRSFLWHNANATTVYMRDGIVKYFKILYANVLKMCDAKSDCIDDVYYITHWLHEFLLDCFEIGSCYQRKILGLSLYRAILSFSNGNGLNKSHNIENTSCTLLLQKHLKATGNWKFTNKQSLFALLKLVLDSATDVKQLSTFIIVNYFDKDVLTNLEKQVLYRVALKRCNSSKFYEIESGAALVSILANWVPINILEGTILAVCDKNEYRNCNNRSRYSDFLLNEAASQLTQMKEDILKAIVQNKPFYGMLTALLNIVFKSGPESCCLTSEFVEKILHLLKDATDFFLSVLSSKSENREYSSSFAEMGLAINEVIKNSEVNRINFDELNLTPAHQVLISCIWMSLKVTCEIACEIGILMYSDEIVECSTDIIVAILLRCRHKGVVESAGTAIGHLTRRLCKETKYCDLPKTHILRILENYAMHSLNITRRGAGLSIMFHKIVVSDNRRDRPLLHFAVQKLLDLLDDFSNASLNSVEFKHDSPWARHLHFLCTLVADKEIRAQLIPHMQRISLTCFKYLESEIWTIRNASLQLFGAIVPRLVGQSYGEILDFGNGYPIDHFVTHYPVLADYVIKELHTFSSTFMNFSTALYLHSNIVHILILLSKFSSSDCSLIGYSSQEFTSKAKYLLRTLFLNPVLYVRLLAAKAYAALTDFLSIESEITQLKRDVSSSRNVNLIHGYLLTMKYLKEKLSIEADNINLQSNCIQYTIDESEQCVELLRFRKILRIWSNMAEKLNNPQICYMLEVLFLQLSESISDQIHITDIFLFDQNVAVLSSEKIKPGFFQFVDLSMKLYADHVKRTNSIDCGILHKILDSCCINQSTSFLNYLGYCIPVLKCVLTRLLLNEYDCNELLLNAMVNYVLRNLKYFPLSHISELHIEKFLDNLSFQTEESETFSSFWRLKCVLVVMFSKNETIISKILSDIFDLCIHEEEHMRQMAVEFIQFSVRRFTELTNENQLTILYCCLILLKDEILEIRQVIAESLRAHVLQIINIERGNSKHTEYIYQKLLSEIIFDRSKSATNKNTNSFFVKLFTHSIKNMDVDATIENPFYHDDNPFYREESKFLNLCFYYIVRNKYSSNKCSIENSAERNDDDVIDVLSKNGTKYQLQEKCLDSTNLEVFLNTKCIDYLLRKQRIVIQEYD
ncbi:uncharacterized protein LOC122403313 isoform X1 [Colletes gigas]|uniref:uncharacterized protein LOC122403313 isoform X1 n=1 Tax=Colletes gigas TaxID=935657 RepID=UPI001C9AE7C7|nr:uncharacterized protein LOC122403313 isoform X1 [Colletes gigas]